MPRTRRWGGGSDAPWSARLLMIVEPGLTEARYWRPDRPQPVSTPRPADVLAGVGRKTHRG